jgi:hypothetical protein
MRTRDKGKDGGLGMKKEFRTRDKGKGKKL